MKVLNAAQMQACDRAAIDDHGIPELVLMENAGVQVVECMEDFFGDAQPEVLAVLCGKGNNGGDGLVIARHLHAAGKAVRVYLFAEPSSLEGSVAANLAIVESTGIDVVAIADEDAWHQIRDELLGFDCVVDALFGTGISGALRGHFGDVVDAINDSGADVIAVDLPSGLSADHGDITGPTVVADLTVTFAAPKLCHVLAPACECIGELNVVDIGIPATAIEALDDAVELITPEECSGAVGPRDPESHKGSYGRVLIVGGAPGMGGAPALTAQGALRGGAGLVTVAAPESIAAVTASLVAEALVRPHPTEDHGGLGDASREAVDALAASTDVLAVGPGIGTAEETTALVRHLVTGAQAPVVLDADGLNAFAGDAAALQSVGPPCVLTPHPGEAGRLLGLSTAEVQADRLAAGRRLAADSGCIVILKGYRSLVCEPSGGVAVNPTGNPGMATGGSGDVLTGLVAALMAQGVEAYRAARLGAFLHGMAGDIAAQAVGEMSLIASDIVVALPQAIVDAEVETP